MMDRNVLVLVLWLGVLLEVLAGFSRADTCSCESVPYRQYTLALPPVEYNGVDTLGPSCTSQSNIAACTMNGLLGNGLPMSLDLNINAVHAWNEDVDIVFILENQSIVRQVNLFFHHDPSQGIGLPSAELYWSNDAPLLPDNLLSHIVVANQNLSQSDVRRHCVSLVVTSTIPATQFFRIRFTLPSNQINWLLLYEVQLRNITGELEPDESTVTVSSSEPSVTLGCELWGYVATDEITWTFNNTELMNDSTYTITTEEGSTRILQFQNGMSRPSVRSLLTIQGLSAHQEPDIYTCSSNGRMRTVSLTVQDSATTTTTATTTTDPTSSTDPTSTTGTTGTVTSTSTDSTTTTITDTLSSPVTSPTTPPPNSSNSSAAVIVGVVIAVVFFIVLVAALIVVIIFLMYRKRGSPKVDLRTRENGNSPPHRRYTAEDIEWQVYSTINKQPPPVPPQNFDETELADVVNKGYEDYTPDKPARRMTALSQCSSPPKLAKISDSSKFKLSPNPIYENDAEHPREPNPSSELHIYADPAREMSLSPIPNQKINDPIYSEPLEPSLFRRDQKDVDNNLHPYGPIYADPMPLKKSEAPLEVCERNLREIRQLGVGQFGEVVLAETKGLSLRDLKLDRTDDDKRVNVQVAVKKLKPQAQSSVQEAFEKEIKFMSRLKDDNIVRLLAICTTESPFIVMEYMENGDLNQYLQKHKLAASDAIILPNQLPISILLYMAVQIASGMRYLASLKFVHRDMATRNCLIGRNFVVKIADFGMSRSLYERAYYRVRGRAMLPIRWMATESFYGRFSEKSDVWAYGTTMWEIFTLSKKQPYDDLDDQELIQDAIRGAGRKILNKPKGCPQEVYEVMLRCWEYYPDERADFEEVFSSLSAIHSSMV